MSDGRFAGRKILITGGASGIGLAVARMVHDEGGAVALVDLDGDRLAAATDGLGRNATAHVCDVTDEAAFQAALSAASAGGAPDGLVCCAGMPDVPRPAEEIEIAEWARIVDSHLKGTMISCKTVGAAMLASGRPGAIVNIASVLSFNAGPVVAYGAAKAAVVNLTASLGAQWAGRGVRVNAVAPGWTDTPFLKPAARGGERDYGPILAATPLGRLIRPEEIAQVISFLLSPEASAIIGTTVRCDGGVVAGCGWAPYGGFAS